ncbi:MAG: dihydropteroate synthase [Salinivirgaceae bacterium]|nr:dihydropteroate synthase [Salinivirgaceae bacterium]
MTTINCRGRLIDLSEPKVMAIVNVTPDSFYSGSRCPSTEAALARADEALAQGADILDLGAYSTRPGAAEVPAEEEWQRLQPVVTELRRRHPQAVISIDTFRSSVAERAVDAGADIINDVSGGTLDEQMFATVARLQVPYILMHMRGTPATMQQHTTYNNLLADVISELSQPLRHLTDLGVHDVIIDPGFGFAKTLEQNYELFAHLSEFSVFNRPLLVGISRKSMIYKLFNITPEQSLSATTALNLLALKNGASILRVHDVPEAVQVVKMWQMMNQACAGKL